MRRARSTLGLVALLVTVRCNFGTTPRTGGTETPTVTPAPLPPTESRTPSPTPEPPRIEQPGPYVSAHLDPLSGRPSAVAESFEVRFANGTAYHEREVAAAVAADRDVYRYRSETRALAPDSPFRDGESALYSNGTLVAYRTVTAGSEEVGVVTVGNVTVDPSNVYAGTPRNEGRLAYLLRSLTNVTLSGGEPDLPYRDDGGRQTGGRRRRGHGGERHGRVLRGRGRPRRAVGTGPPRYRRREACQSRRAGRLRRGGSHEGPGTGVVRQGGVEPERRLRHRSRVARRKSKPLSGEP